MREIVKATRHIYFFIFLLFSLCFGGHICWAQEANVEKIFSEFTFQGLKTEFFIRKVPTSYTRIATGCSFKVHWNGKDYLLTAKHVINPGFSRKTLLKAEGEDEEIQYDDKKTVLQKVILRSRVSGLSLKPSAIYWEPQIDISYLILESNDITLLNLRTLQPSNTNPKILDSVTAWGFPATSNPQLREIKIAAVYDDYLVLNDSLDHGFSGGPLLNSNGELIGIIIRSEEKQSRALRITNDLLSRLFSSEPMRYTDSLEIPLPAS
jgi:Trypsin-like peptidase domain